MLNPTIQNRQSVGSEMKVIRFVTTVKRYLRNQFQLINCKSRSEDGVVSNTYSCDFSR